MLDNESLHRGGHAILRWPLPEHMDRFLTFHWDEADEFPPRLLADLTLVAHHSHLPIELPRDARDGDLSSGENDPTVPPIGCATTCVPLCYRQAPFPRI